MKALYLTLFSLLLVQAHATVRRVRGGTANPGNGQTWNTAYSNLQSAIDASAAGDELWVAVPFGQGPYKPLVAGTSFSLKNGVKIYGGFAGSETLLSQRDTISASVLLHGNGASVITCNAVGASTVLDNVTISLGSAINGGGISCNNASPTIRNVYISYNSASGFGGGMYNFNSNPQLTNVIIHNNQAFRGGGIFNSGSSVTLNSCVIFSNMADTRPSRASGGGLYNQDTTSINAYNCVFYNNNSSAVYSLNSSSNTFINCTFVSNTGPGSAINGGDPIANSLKISNCIFWGNGNNPIISSGSDGPDMVINNSYLQNVIPGPPGSGNVNCATSGVCPMSPFVNSGDPNGADNKWMTVDDGLQLSLCNAALLIDKGINTDVPATPDLARQPRTVLIPLYTASGTARTDMGAYENQLNASTAQLAGSIGNAHLIPYPQELIPDYVTNTLSPVTSPTNFTWQQQTPSGTWVAATPDGSGPSYSIPQLTQITNYRRVASSPAYCNTPFYSNVVQISVANPTPAQAGKIRGRITSPNGTTGVQGIVIKVTRRDSISGSPQGYTYTDTTDSDGRYLITPVYYGDLNQSSSSAYFTVMPVLANHGFNPDSLPRTVSYFENAPPDADFEDTTVLSISGRIYQTCSGCLPVSGSAPQCPVDSVSIFKGGSFYTTTQYINGQFGRYGVTAPNPVPVVIEPRFTGHTFLPAYASVVPSIAGTVQDFEDTTTHTISGSVKAGCGELIGITTLEFSDTLPPNTRGTIRPQGCFRRQVTTGSNGNYTVRLPARPYKVKVISFTPSSGAINPIQATDLMFFINEKLPVDSLYRDITTHDTILNLTYLRPPIIAIVQGLTLQTCPNPLGNFSIVKQAEVDSFRVKIFSGQPVNNATGCAITDSINKMVLFTNVPSQSMANDSASFNPVAVGRVVYLKGGSPNIAGNHFKSLALYYTDKYGRSTSLVRNNILVTGSLQDAGANFFTVNPPPIPLLVLHDPPGDGSYSFWESTKSTQTAFRMYASSTRELGGWLEVKLGTKLSTGIFVSTESEVWATANGTLTNGKTNTSATEQIFTKKYTNSLATSSSTEEVGADGDVYVGMALNMIYTSATEISYNNCEIRDTSTMIFAPGGVPTEFNFSEKHIKNVILPGLRNARDAQSNNFKKDSVQNIIGQWEQMVANNVRNKANAASTNTNTTFNGGGSINSSSFTSTKSTVNTTEFSMNIDAGLAIAAGFDIAGSGLSGGAIVNFKTETGESTVLDTTTETTVGYALTDANSGDQFTVNIKKDRQSGTPVFELLAGQSSCPPEEGTQLRDQVQLAAPNPIATDTNQVGTLEYQLYVGNISPINTDPSRVFNLFVDASTNSDGAIVSINAVSNTSASNPVPITVARLAQQQITVRVSKAPTSPVFSYTGLALIVVDPCTGDITDTARLSAYFISPCSSVKMDEPGDGWVQADTSYQKQIVIKGYDRSRLSTVNLQYAAAGSTIWNDVFPAFTPATLNPNPTLGTAFSWNNSNLPDGAYNIRLKLICQQGIVYSEKTAGIIDHTAPLLLGKPGPTDDNYVNGDVISFSYNEDIFATNLDTTKVTMTRLTNGLPTPVAINVTGYKNSLVIVPVNSINSYVGSTMRVIVKNISDVYGNIKTRPDTSYFLVGATTIATGTNAMRVNIANSRVSKNSDSTINFSFKLPVAVTADSGMRVNYTISGTARLGIDYTIEYVGYQPSYAYFNAVQGAIRLPKSADQVMFRIRPVGDTALTPDKTVIISLSEGGDYALGDTTTRTGIIISEDAITTYTFIGDGNFNVKNNWLNGRMPLTTLAPGKEIIIDPSGVCRLNGPLTLKPTAKLTVRSNKQFIQGKPQSP